MRLVGLPEKITAPEAQVSKDNKEIAFELKVDPQCPPGSYKNLFCTVDIRQSEGTIPHVIAPGGVVRVVPPKQDETAKQVAASKPAK
jgi:hypothetical protein